MCNAESSEDIEPPHRTAVTFSRRVRLLTAPLQLRWHPSSGCALLVSNLRSVGAGARSVASLAWNALSSLLKRPLHNADSARSENRRACPLPPQFFYGIADWRTCKTLDEAAIQASQKITAYAITIDNQFLLTVTQRGTSAR